MHGYDIIGDIHGHADRLERLLRALGYGRSAGRWRPPHGRQAIFTGDLINRGPGQLATCRIVRAMIDAGDARAVLGNHEIHAIGYGTAVEADEAFDARAVGDSADPPVVAAPSAGPSSGSSPGLSAGLHAGLSAGPCSRGRSTRWLRPRTPWADRQHRAFLAEVGRDSALHREWIDWLRTLPVALELGTPGQGIRVAHAWWDDASVAAVEAGLPGGNLATDEGLRAALAPTGRIAAAVEGLTRGRRLELAPDQVFTDSRGLRHVAIWARWWVEEATTLRELAFIDDIERSRVPALPLPIDYAPTRVAGRPVFVGHYWLDGLPRPFTPKVACVDWSASPGQPLMAYRWDGETTLEAERFVSSEGRAAEVAMPRATVAEYA